MENTNEKTIKEQNKTVETNLEKRKSSVELKQTKKKFFKIKLMPIRQLALRQYYQGKLKLKRKRKLQDYRLNVNQLFKNKIIINQNTRKLFGINLNCFIREELEPQADLIADFQSFMANNLGLKQAQKEKEILKLKSADKRVLKLPNNLQRELKLPNNLQSILSKKTKEETKNTSEMDQNVSIMSFTKYKNIKKSLEKFWPWDQSITGKNSLENNNNYMFHLSMPKANPFRQNSATPVFVNFGNNSKSKNQCSKGSNLKKLQLKRNTSSIEKVF